MQKFFNALLSHWHSIVSTVSANSVRFLTNAPLILTPAIIHLWKEEDCLRRITSLSEGKGELMSHPSNTPFATDPRSIFVPLRETFALWFRVLSSFVAECVRKSLYTEYSLDEGGSYELFLSTLEPQHQ